MFFFAIETATSILIFGSVDNSRNNAHAPRHILHRASEPWHDLKTLKNFQSHLENACLFEWLCLYTVPRMRANYLSCCVRSGEHVWESQNYAIYR